jgi:hypothetical protein
MEIALARKVSRASALEACTGGLDVGWVPFARVVALPQKPLQIRQWISGSHTTRLSPANIALGSDGMTGWKPKRNHTSFVQG